MTFLRYLGQFKYRAMRLAPYNTIFQTAILIGFGWKWWYIFLFVGMIVAYIFEKRHGIPGELDVAWKNSAEWQQFRKEWDEFRKR